jgi:hypothetical protein
MARMLRAELDRLYTLYVQLREAGMAPSQATNLLCVTVRTGRRLDERFGDQVVYPSEVAARHHAWRVHRDRGASVAAAARLLGVDDAVAYLAYEAPYQEQVNALLAVPGPGAHWADRAVCGRAGIDPERWEARNSATSLSSRQVQPALALCRVCPVRDQCLSDALEAPEEHTRFVILGGLTPRELLARRSLGAAA